MNKIWLVFFIFYLTICSCSTIKNQSFPDCEKNVNTVKKIIDNYLTLEIYLNNKTISDTFLIKSGFKYEIPTLKEHIIKNKFYEGYKFEIKDSIEKLYFLTHNYNGEKSLFDTNNYVIYNLIKIRSNFNEDIIWFIFDYYKDEKKWKFLSAEYCNNYNQRVWGDVDVPCDKE